MRTRGAIGISFDNPVEGGCIEHAGGEVVNIVIQKSFMDIGKGLGASWNVIKDGDAVTDEGDLHDFETRRGTDGLKFK